jgi:hypothetical protein
LASVVLVVFLVAAVHRDVSSISLVEWVTLGSELLLGLNCWLLNADRQGVGILYRGLLVFEILIFSVQNL